MPGSGFGSPSSNASDGDDLLFRCAVVALGCGCVAVVAAGFGCANQTLELFTPELSWLFLAPSALVVAVSTVGLCASSRATSKLRRMQLAVFLAVGAGLLAAAGVFVYISAGASADWVVEGCQGFRGTGLWGDAGRISGKMERVQEQYLQLRAGLLACRSLDPLVFDLSRCGVRARCSNGRLAEEQQLYRFFEHAQLSYSCGGFCEDEVPLFGTTSIEGTLQSRGACAQKVSDAVESFGHIFSGIAVVVAVPVLGSSLVLLAAAGRSDEDFGEDSEGSEGYELVSEH